MSEEFLTYTFLDNTVKQWMWFAASIVLAFLFKKLISKFLGLLLYRLFRKMSEESLAGEFVKLLLSPIEYFVVVLTIYIGLGLLQFPHQWDITIHDLYLKIILVRLLHTVLVISITWIILKMIDFIAVILARKAAETEDKLDDQLVPFIRDFLKVVVVIICTLFILGAVFKFNIYSLLAGVGIGGLAVAFAAKESIENLISSFIIFIDRPFTVGDLVKVGDITGTVEEVGFRSTRIRTAEKTFLTVPNSKIVNSTLDNLTLRTHRKVEFSIGLTYNSSLEQIKFIINDIHQALNEHSRTNKDDILVNFHQFGENSLNIGIQYFIVEMPYKDFMKIKEEINFKIMEIVKSHGAEFAFPTRTVILNK